jgi:hypothetical protein
MMCDWTEFIILKVFAVFTSIFHTNLNTNRETQAKSVKFLQRPSLKRSINIFLNLNKLPLNAKYFSCHCVILYLLRRHIFCSVYSNCWLYKTTEWIKTFSLFRDRKMRTSFTYWIHFLCLEIEKCVHHLLTEFIFYSKISSNLPFILHIPKLLVFRSVWHFITQCDCLFAMCR